MKKDYPLVQGSKFELPNNDGGLGAILTLTGAGISKGKDLVEGVKAGKDLLGRLPPLSVSILTSTTSSAHCRIRLKIRNNTMHGIYLEELQIKEPKDIELKAHSLEGSIGLTSAAESSEYFPLSIEPQHQVEFDISFLAKAVEGRKKNPYVILECQFSQLNTKASDTLTFLARVRQHHD